MTNKIYQVRLRKCNRLVKAAGIDVFLAHQTLQYVLSHRRGRLCAYAMITQKGKVALGVPQTDVKDVKSLAYFNYLVGFEG